MKFNIEEFKAKTKEIVNNNLGKGNTALAKLILKGSEYADSHSAIEYLRNWIANHKEELINAPDEEVPDYMKGKVDNMAGISINSFSEWDMTNYSPPIIPSTTVPPFEGEIIGFNKAKEDRVLLIADLHIPFEKEGYFEHCVKVYKEFNCNKAIIIGDEIDSNSISFHPKNPDLYSPKDELDLAKDKLKRWYSQFPNAIVLNGNHTNLIKRKIADAGLPSQVMKPLNEILEVSNWKYYDEYIHNGILYIHGTGLTNTSVEKKVMYSQLPVVMGHLHSTSRIQYYTQGLFSMILGCGCDGNALAFEYNRTNPKPGIISCGVMVDKTPILLPL